MKIFKRILNITLLMSILITLFENNWCAVTSASTSYCQRLPMRVGFFTRDINDDYMVFLKKNFEDIQKNNQGKVAFEFYNANFNQSTQSADIENALNKGIDLILLDMVNLNEIQELINKIQKFNVPVILFNRVPFSMDSIKSYKKAFYVGTDSVQGGTLQGKMIVDAWNNHKELIDTDKDNVLQYIMLVGEKLSKNSIDRSTYSISAIQQAGIKTQELESPVLNWSTELAENAIGSMFLRYGSKIEAIISNDDSMAIGAVKALQKYGYNNGNKSKSIAVVGLDGVPDAKELVSKGFMLGTASQETADMANAIYTVGMNLVNGRNPIDGVTVKYRLDESGLAMLLPYEAYTGPMFQ